jgi:hypothetical protein
VQLRMPCHAMEVQLRMPCHAMEVQLRMPCHAKEVQLHMPWKCSGASRASYSRGYVYSRACHRAMQHMHNPPGRSAAEQQSRTCDTLTL